ncbi:hypothetical protein [Anaeromyxobacter paludicola]|uniref:Uncharacterized protein n=1 Tax=Anaeromyxobacter paludicola TaxID=2918171 RepID=A0ABN6N8G5_9BACT|nr:hypothetical protein [Anaeromyxobacter paludicola]BDG09506.1 hypothetical protein AMPC_26190 [Anaeromyxobacter paludicola]
MKRTFRRTALVLLLGSAATARAAGAGKPAGFDDAAWPDDPTGAAAAPQPASAEPTALGPGLPAGHDDTAWPVEALGAGRDDAFAVGPALPAGHDDATWAPSPVPAPPLVARAAR